MELWSWALTAIGVLGLFLAGSKNRLGWMIGIFAQVLWFTYAIATSQYGFLFSAFAYAFVYTRNWIKWSKKEVPEVNTE